jgi:hypothetical protein
VIAAVSPLAATMRARRGAATTGASPVEATITFRLGDVRSALWARLLDEHIAQLESEASHSWLPRSGATPRRVRALRARLEWVLATVPCLETSSLREDFERLVLAPSNEGQP